MKKFLVLLLSLMMVLCFGACTPSTSPSPDPTPDPAPSPGPDPGPTSDEVDVELIDFLKAMGYETGRWACPVQAGSYYLDFYSDGRAMVAMIDDVESMQEDLYEIKKVTYSAKNHMYTAYLQEEGLDNINFLLHVDVERLSLGYIMAENIWDEEKVVEYIFETITLVARYELRDPDVNDMYRPYVEFYSDGTFVFYENLYEGMGFIYGRYDVFENTYDCYVGENGDLQGYAGYDVKQFSFKSSGSGIVLQQDLCYSRKGSVFDAAGSEGSATMLGRYELRDSEVSNEYRPYVEFYEDGKFIFYENLYEGMGFIYGHYDAVGDMYACHVDNNEELNGTVGYGVKEFTFKFASSGPSLVLQQDICYSQKGAIFDLH
ncbi:MAG: hypothetical protein IJI05_03685 [Erysipelotrichaceae bacterium]|nr:hypothetical protein [Erysipelotrichaceae bacterium]